MVKIDFVITCLGLFLIIILALMIGNLSKIEEFSYLSDFNKLLFDLNQNITNIKDQISDKQLQLSIQTSFANVVQHISGNGSNAMTNIKNGSEVIFLIALVDLRTIIQSIPSTTNTSLINLQKTNNIIINNISNFIMTNVINLDLPVELRTHLGKIWWNCTLMHRLITDPNLASEFKLAYDRVTNYAGSSAFILKTSDIGQTSDAITQYFDFIKTLRDKLNLVYDPYKQTIAESDKKTILSDLDSLVTYLKTGTFPTSAPTPSSPQLTTSGISMIGLGPITPMATTQAPMLTTPKATTTPAPTTPKATTTPAPTTRAPKTTLPLSELQKTWESIGCKRKLTEGDVNWWRTIDIESIKKDMATYFNLTSTCSGKKEQHDFCSQDSCNLTRYDRQDNKDQSGQTIGKYSNTQKDKCILDCNNSTSCKGMVMSKDNCWTIKGTPSVKSNNGYVLYKKK